MKTNLIKFGKPTPHGSGTAYQYLCMGSSGEIYTSNITSRELLIVPAKYANPHITEKGTVTDALMRAFLAQFNCSYDAAHRYVTGCIARLNMIPDCSAKDAYTGVMIYIMGLSKQKQTERQMIDNLIELSDSYQMPHIGTDPIDGVSNVYFRRYRVVRALTASTGNVVVEEMSAFVELSTAIKHSRKISLKYKVTIVDELTGLQVYDRGTQLNQNSTVDDMSLD